MNALKILSRGNQNLADALKGLPEESWTDGFATGTWTVKDIVSHLGAYEARQVEAFKKFLDPSIPTPLRDAMAKGYAEFNSDQWEKGKNEPWDEILARYNKEFEELMGLLEGMEPEQLSRPDGTFWYGEPCSLEDVIAFNYGHKKHHIAQIKLFRQRNNI